MFLVYIFIFYNKNFLYLSQTFKNYFTHNVFKMVGFERMMNISQAYVPVISAQPLWN